MSKARFIEPMLLLRTEKLPEGEPWAYELKLDGYRALAIKTGGKIHLRSRNDNDFNGRYPSIVKALEAMPEDTVVDGEVVALDHEGKPSFNLLQNYGSDGAPLHFFIFDLLVLKGKDVMGEPLTKRRELIEEHVLPELADPIRYSLLLEGSDCPQHRNHADGAPLNGSHSRWAFRIFLFWEWMAFRSGTLPGAKSNQFFAIRANYVFPVTLVPRLKLGSCWACL
jgi:hypothetical protein